MKNILSLFLVFILYLSGFAQPIDPASYSSPVKVACIGNSITFGSGIADRPRDSYPAQLGRMLGDHWIVRNFGVGGRTMLKKGDFPYWKEDAWVIDLYSALSGMASSFPDQIHPNAEGDGLMAQAIAKKLTGRDITVVNSQYPGEKSPQGHHFPIDNLKAGVDFILNSYPQVPLPLDSRNYHTYRNKLHNSRIVFGREKRGRVAFLGGSITYNGDWRDSICAYLQKRFPNTQFDFVAAGIPSMGSTPGAFRFERDVLAKGKVDLLFVIHT